jgi:dolichol kinase
VFLVVTAFPDERHRTWRAVPVAQTLAFPLAACWAVELWRLNRVRRAKDPNAGRANIVARAAEGFFAKALRENERDKVHGTAWYLLGAFTSLLLYPCDVAALSVCALAFCDPAASLVGRSVLFRAARFNRRFANGKSVLGFVACFSVGVLTTWLLFRPATGVFSVDDADASASFVILFGVVVGVVVAVVEFLGSKTFVDDNALIPVLVGAVAWPARGALLGWE